MRGQEGVLGGGGHFGPEVQKMHMNVMNCFFPYLPILSTWPCLYRHSCCDGHANTQYYYCAGVSTLLICVLRCLWCGSRVGQDRTYTPYMTVYLVMFLPIIPSRYTPYIYGSGQPYAVAMPKLNIIITPA